MATTTVLAIPTSPFSMLETEAEPYMHCLAPTDSERQTFIALPSAEDLDLEQQLLKVEAVAATIVHTPKKSKKGKKEKDVSSGPPSPPDSDPTTPRISIPPCPKRLEPLIPPPNYGAVEPRMIFRSSYPQDRHMDFVKKLGVRSILTLVPTEPSEGYAKWLKDSGITQLHVDIAPNKEGVVNTTLDSLCEAVLFAMDSRNWPLYIHCNQGKHRTGCVVACLRKINHTPIDDIIAEYTIYSAPKDRLGDKELIKSFNPDDVYRYAATHGYIDSMARRDSSIAINNIDTLAAVLAAGATSDLEDIDMDLVTMSPESSARSSTDGGLEMQLPKPAIGHIDMAEDHGVHDVSTDAADMAMTEVNHNGSPQVTVSSIDPALEDLTISDPPRQVTVSSIDPALDDNA